MTDLAAVLQHATEEGEHIAVLLGAMGALMTRDLHKLRAHPFSERPFVTGMLRKLAEDIERDFNVCINLGEILRGPCDRDAARYRCSARRVGTRRESGPPQEIADVMDALLARIRDRGDTRSSGAR